MTLLTRTQQNKTNNFIHYFVYFLLYVLAINADGIIPIISSKLSMRSNQGNIAVVICAPSGANCETQAMIANCIRFRRAANVGVGPPRPQSNSRRPNTSTYTKHAPPKRAQLKNMVRPTPPLCCVDRSHRLCATGWSPLQSSESNAFAAEACTGTCERISISRNRLEEQAAGYQAAYSKLATAGTPVQDIVA